MFLNPGVSVSPERPEKNTRNILKHPSVISQPGNEREGHMVRYHAWTPSCTVPAITIADIWLKNMTRGGIFI